ncbi:MAG: ATP-binding cassette domain-containing protein [Bacillota bacterium]
MKINSGIQADMFAFENVTIEFNGRLILKNFSLKIKENEKILIYGKSGIGKSTILKLALGNLRPQSGRILYKGRPLSREVVWQVRKEAAYVSQDMEIGNGKVKEFLKLVFSYKANSHLSDISTEINELSDYFELNRDSLEKNIEDLSGGEKQRFMIITAILLKRKIFLLDEVTSGLDPVLKKKVISFFLNESNWTEIIVSHDNDWLSDGRIKNLNMEETTFDA